MQKLRILLWITSMEEKMGRKSILSALFAVALAVILLLNPQAALAQSGTIDLKEIGQIDGGIVVDVVFDDNKLYTVQADSADAESGTLVIYDANDASNLVELGRLNLSGVGPLAVDNGKLYISASNLFTFDVVDPTTPTLLSTFNPFDEVVGRPWALSDYLFVGYSKVVNFPNNPNCIGDTITEYGLMSIYVGDGTAPTLLGEVASPKGPYAPALCEQHARPVEMFRLYESVTRSNNFFIVLTEGLVGQRDSSIQGWWTVDVNSPPNPASRDFISSERALLTHGFVDNNNLYTTSASFWPGTFTELSRLNKRTRSIELPQTGELTICGQPDGYNISCIPNNLPDFGDLVVSENNLFVATTDGIRIFNADDLGERKRTSFGNADSLLTLGNGVIFMGSTNGIKVLRIEEETPPPPPPPPPPPSGNDLRLFGDSLASGWHAGTLGSVNYNLMSSDPVAEGIRSISVSLDSEWSAFFLNAETPVDPSTVTGLRFSVYGTEANQTLRIKTISSIWEQSMGRTITLEQGKWTQVTVTKEELGEALDYRYLLFENPTAHPQPVIYLDDITLLGGGNGGGGGENHPPVVQNPGDQTTFRGQFPFSLDIQASDPDNDSLSFSAINLPDGLSVNPTSGRITGSPMTPGQYDVSITVSDGQDSVTIEFGWTVREETGPGSTSALSIYDDAVAEGWKVGAWGSTTIDPHNTHPVSDGSNSLAVTYNERWSTLYFRAPEPLDKSNYVSLSFDMRGTESNQRVKVQFMDRNLKTTQNFFNLGAGPDEWGSFNIPLFIFEDIDSIYYILIQNPDADGGQPTFYLDNVKLDRAPGVQTDGVAAADIDYSAVEYGDNGLPTRFKFNTQSGRVEQAAPARGSMEIFLPFTVGNE